MPDYPSPETQSQPDAQQDAFFDQSETEYHLTQLNYAAGNPSPVNEDVTGVTRRRTSGSTESRVPLEARQPSENHAAMAEGLQVDGGEAQPPELGDLPVPPPSTHDDDTIAEHSCYIDSKLEWIESYLIPVSSNESDCCPICREKYNITLDDPAVENKTRYCMDCERYFTMTHKIDKFHKACVIPQCSHVFGRYCITQWLKNNSTCPLCREWIDIM
ncbi:hypothetical protein ACHAP3_010182 [Botrytis cinerea]